MHSSSIPRSSTMSNHQTSNDEIPFPRRDIYLINRRMGKRLLWMFAIMPAVVTVGSCPGTLVYSVLMQDLEDSRRAIKPKMETFEALAGEELLYEERLFADAGADVFGPLYHALAICRHENRTYTLKVIRLMHDANFIPSRAFAKWYNLLSAPVSGFIASHTLPVERDWGPFVDGFANKRIFIQAPSLEMPDQSLTNTAAMEALFDKTIQDACVHLGVFKHEISLKRTIIRMDEPGGPRSVAAISLFLLSREATPDMTTLYILYQPARHSDLLRIAALYPEIKVGAGAPNVQKTDYRRSELPRNQPEQSSRGGSSSGSNVRPTAGDSFSRTPPSLPIPRGPDPPPGHAFASPARQAQKDTSESSSNASRSSPNLSESTLSSSRPDPAPTPAPSTQQPKALVSTSSSSSSSSGSGSGSRLAPAPASLSSSARPSQVAPSAGERQSQRQGPTSETYSPASSSGRKARTSSRTRQDTQKDTQMIDPKQLPSPPEQSKQSERSARPRNIPRRPEQEPPKPQGDAPGASGASSAPKPACSSLTDLAEMMMAMSPPSRPSSNSAPVSRTQSSSSKKSTRSAPMPGRRALLTRAQFNDLRQSRDAPNEDASPNPLSGFVGSVQTHPSRTAAPRSSRKAASAGPRLGAANSGSSSSTESSSTSESCSSSGTFAFPTPPSDNQSPRPMPEALD